MNITVNGEQMKVQEAISLPVLLASLSAPADRVAVMVNDEVVSRLKRDGFVLKEGDRIEILAFAAGG